MIDADAADRLKAEQRAKALEFAKNYLVFVQDGRAKTLLEFWTKAMADRRVPVDATIQAYARAEEFRAFIQGIHNQIRIAQTGDVGTTAP